jgi:hypothetical protein
MNKRKKRKEKEGRMKRGIKMDTYQKDKGSALKTWNQIWNILGKQNK